jgi:accessory gene regulator B
MIIRLAENLAVAIKNANPEQTASVEVMKYALLGIINTVGTILMSILFGMATGKLLSILLALFAFGFLRYFSGGLHLKTPASCMLVSTVIICVVPFIPVTQAIGTTMLIISLLLILIYAPSNVRGFARLPEKYYPILKIISLVIVSSNLLIGSSILTVTFFFQSLSLIVIRKEVH